MTQSESDLFWGISADAVFTTISTLLVLSLGYIGNRLYEHHKRRVELNSLKEYFVSLVELLDVPIQRQVDSFILFARRLKEKKDGGYSLGTVAAFNLENIKTIKHFDLYELFLKGRNKNIPANAAAFQSMQVNLHMIEMVKEKFSVEYDGFHTKALALEHKWRAGMTGYREAYDKLWANKAAVGFTTGFPDPLHVELQKLQKDWLQTTNYASMYVAIDKFIRPMRELCLRYPGGQGMPIFLKHAMDCIDAYENYVHVHKKYRRTFLLYARKLRGAKWELDAAIKTLAQ